jgi:6-phosphogluconolactonase
MNFSASPRAALSNRQCLRWTACTLAILLAGLSVSCGSSSSSSSASHNAYVTLPAGSVRLLHINNSTGAITIGAQTPPVQGATPTGLVLHSSKKFLFVANSDANTISVFNVASDGTLTLSGNPTPAGSGPRGMALDPAGQFLLVTNTVSNDISLFSVDSGTGALTAVGPPVPAHAGPTEILMTPSGKFVYVTSPSTGFITAFTFAGGVLTEVQGSPFGSGAGVSAIAVESSEHFLYAANTTANTISGFAIDSGSIPGSIPGALTPVGSPFSPTAGTGPSALAVDTLNKFLYVATQGSSASIWALTFDSTTGTLTQVTNSPFSLSAGGLFLVMEPSGSFFYIGNQSGTNIAAYKYDSGTGAPTAVTGSPFSTGSAPAKMVIVH